MSFWDRFRRGARPVDKTDGYTPPTLPAADPWQDPAIVEQMKARSALDHMDSRNLDGFKNELTGIGDWLRDKTMGGKQGGLDFEVRFLSGNSCENRWRGSDLGARLVETIPDEMTREGFDITIQPTEDDGTKKDFAPPQAQPPLMIPSGPPMPGALPEIDDEGPRMAEELMGALEEMGLEEAFWSALCYERAYGGGAILIGADDGQEELAAPLDEERITSIRHLTAFRGGWDGELVAWSWYRDPRSPKYGQPEIYMLRNDGVPLARVPAPGEKPTAEMLAVNTNAYGGPHVYWVHESRLLVFPGVAASRRARVQMRGWGDSLFTRVDEVLAQYAQTWGGVANLMTDFSQGVLSIEGLAEALGGNNRNGTAKVTARALALQMSRSIARLLLIDKDEEFKRDTASLAGIGDVLQQFALRLAAAADMPVALLMGQAPAGLNATGASDIRFFYDRVAAKQNKRMLPQLRRLVRLLMLAKDGPTNGVEPDRWSVSFRPLYQMTALEQADLRLKVAQTDDIYLRNGVLSPEEVAASCYGGSEWSMERTIDFEGREAAKEELPPAAPTPQLPPAKEPAPEAKPKPDPADEE